MAKPVGHKLQDPEVDGLARAKAGVTYARRRRADAESVQLPLPGTPTVDVSITD